MHFPLTYDEGRKYFDYVHGVTGDLGENTMPAQHLSNNHLREKHLVHSMQ
jgi:hypothetical protein